MDQPQYTKVMALVADLPDPRKPRGKQLEWTFIWGVILTAMLSQQRSPTAIASGLSVRRAPCWPPSSPPVAASPVSRPSVEPCSAWM